MVRQGPRSRRRRHRHERPAREEHADHAREPRGAERARAGRDPRASSAAPRSTRTYVERDLREVYDGRVFYGKDAFEGLHTLDELMNAQACRPARRRRRRSASRPAVATCPAREPKPAVDPSTLPSRRRGRGRQPGLHAAVPRLARSIKGIALDDIATYLNETALFRNQWQYRPEKGENDEDFKDAHPSRCSASGWPRRQSRAACCVPQVVYGYFAANADGNDVVIWKDDDRNAEWMRFSLPRQQQGTVPLHRRLRAPVDRNRLRGLPRS